MNVPAAPPRRSDATKSAILAAAREHFAKSGYQAATIRAIAADAGIDPAMVIRYYGNKERLFAAAAKFDLRLPDLADIPASEVGCALVRHFLERWEGDETLMALLRAASTNEAAAAQLQAIFATQVGPALARLRAESRAAAAARSGLIATQILGLALCRYILKLPPVVQLEREELVKRVGATIQAYLHGD
jgi:AcrR family transcriptional regulator